MRIWLCILFLPFCSPQPPGSLEEKYRDLVKALYQPDAAMVATLKLLEAKEPQAFSLLKKHFPKTPLDSQLQILRAIRLKKSPRGLSLLFSHYPRKLPKKLQQEIEKTLVVCGIQKEVQEYLLSLLKAPSVSLSLRKRSFSVFLQILSRLPLPQALEYCDFLFSLPLLKKDYFQYHLLETARKLTGISFQDRENFKTWWKENKVKPFPWWAQFKMKNLEKTLQKKNQELFLWWKQYLDLLEKTHPGRYPQALLKFLSQPPSPQCLLYVLSKLEQYSLAFPPKDREKLVQTLLSLAKGPFQKEEVRHLALRILGKNVSHLPSPLRGKVEDLLLEVFQNSLYLSLRRQACNSLVNLRSPRVLEKLLQSLLKPGESPVIVQEILQNLDLFQETQDNRIARTILLFLKRLPPQKDGQISDILALSMEKLGNLTYYQPRVKQEVVQFLESYLSHPNMKIRYFASSSLGKIQSSSSLPSLCQAIPTSNTAVQRAILKAILSIVEKGTQEKEAKQIIKSTSFLWGEQKFEKLLSLLYEKLLLSASPSLVFWTLSRLPSKAIPALHSTWKKLLTQWQGEKQPKLYRHLLKIYLKEKHFPLALELYQNYAGEKDPSLALYLKLQTAKVKPEEGLQKLEKLLKKGANSPYLSKLFQWFQKQHPELFSSYRKRWQKNPVLQKHPLVQKFSSN